jgi:selenocysteine lyase/cysteine desulfurase
MPGSPNVIGFYRAALSFQLQDWIGLDLIQKRETENAAFFYNKLMEFNKKMEEEHPDRRIEFIGESDLNKRFGVFSFNLLGPGTMEFPSGQKLFHPHFVAKILNDFFGIQVNFFLI